MKISKTLCALAVASAFALVPAAMAAGESHAHGGDVHKLALDNGRKWKTDEPLRAGMESIREQVTEMHLAGERAPLRPEYYQALGASIQNDIADMVRDCKLAPAADANFHIVLAQLDAAAEALKRQTQKDTRRGMKQAREALDRYARYFDHPGWQKRI
jgi:hypothetical protein